MESHLKMVVISELAKKPMSGFALMKRIEESTGCWKPSAGSMYPLLNNLKKSGHVSFRQDRKEKIYFLTGEGKKYFSGMKKSRERIINSLMAKIQLFESMPKEQSATFMLELFRKTNEKGFPARILGEVAPEVIEMRAQVLRLFMQGKISKKALEIKKVLRETTEKLRRL